MILLKLHRKKKQKMLYEKFSASARASALCFAEHNKPIPALFVQRDKFLCNVVNFPPGIVIYLRAA